MAISIEGPALRFIFEAEDVEVDYVWVGASGNVLLGDPAEVRLPYTQTSAQQTMRLSTRTAESVRIDTVLASGSAPWLSLSLASPVTVPATGSVDAVLDFTFDGSQAVGDSVDVDIVGVTGA